MGGNAYGIGFETEKTTMLTSAENRRGIRVFLSMACGVEAACSPSCARTSRVQFGIAFTLHHCPTATKTHHPRDCCNSDYTHSTAR